jgi:hypothetical protein
MNSSDKRSHARAQYLLNQATLANVSARAQASQVARKMVAIPALVLDMSSGGLQIVADDSQALAQGEYALELVTEREVPFAEGHIRLLWSKSDGEVIRNGFEFVSGFAPLAEIEAMLKNDKDRVLRCVLHPVELTQNTRQENNY